MLQHVRHLFGRIAVSAGIIGVLATCDPSTLASPPGIESISIAYGSDTVLALGRIITPQVDVFLDGRPLEEPRLSFRSSDSSIVEIMTDGRINPKRLGTASVAIILRSSLFPSAPPTLVRRIDVVAESISVSTSSMTLTAIGASAVVGATAFDFNGMEIASPPLRWESSHPETATVSQNGIVTARGAGITTVRSILGPDTANVGVTVRQTLASYVLSHEDITLDALADTITVTAGARDANGFTIPPGPQSDPVWTSRDPAGVDVTSAGKITARRNAATWVVAQRGVVADSVRVNVNQRSVRVVISSATGYAIESINGQLQLTAVGFDRNSNPDGNSFPAWSSLDPDTAQVDPISGVVTGRLAGTAQIVATMDSGADTVYVNVANSPSSIVLTPASLSMTSVNDTAQLSVVAYNSLGNPVETQITWRSTDSTVARVVAGARVEARSVGTARIIASASGGTLADTTVVTVTNSPVLIDIHATDVALSYLGQTVTPGVTIRNGRGDALPATAATWSSDAPSIAGVSSAGVITGTGIGSTMVRASSGTVRDSIRVTVTNDPASVVLSSERDTVTAVGRTISFTGQVRNSGGALLAYPISWRSTSEPTATVSSGGVVTAVAFGTTLIIGQAGPVADTITLVVRNPTVLWVDNSVNVAERFGTLSRPYARIQDAVAVTDAGDTVMVRRGFGYAGSVSITRRLTLLGDSSAYVSGGRNPALLPSILHDSGAAGIAATTTGQVSIGYLALTHTMDGPAINTSGADVRIDNFHVNPASTGLKVGRGILVRDAPTFATLSGIVVKNVRGYGVRLERVTQGQADGVTVLGVDSIAGTRGAGIDVYRGSTNAVRFANVRETQGPGVLLDSTSAASVIDGDFAGRTILLRARGVSGSITTIERNRFDLTALPNATDTRSSANDGRAGLEIVASSNVHVRENVFSEAGSLMDGIRLIQAKGGGAFAGVTLFRNRFDNGRYSVRSERSSWSSTESRSRGASAGVFATDADTVRLSSDTVTATTGDACVAAAGSSRNEITGGVLAQCGTAGATGGRAVAVSGSNATLTVQSATLGGPNQTGVSFTGRDLTMRDNFISGAGTRTVSDYLSGGVVEATSSNLMIVRGNTVTDYPTLTALRLDVSTLRLDSNVVARNRSGLQLVDWSTVSGIDNDFSDHELLAVSHTRLFTVNLSGNWWGDPRGPRRSSVPAATGDSLGVRVDAGTVRTAPFNPGGSAWGIRRVRGDGQTAARRDELPLALTVRVMDGLGRPVAGTVVTFTVTEGNGTVSSPTVTTNSSGLAEVTFTLGASAGQNSVKATIAAPAGGVSSVTFNATGS